MISYLKQKTHIYYKTKTFYRNSLSERKTQFQVILVKLISKNKRGKIPNDDHTHDFLELKKLSSVSYQLRNA
jgi:hypothetical protein